MSARPIRAGGVRSRPDRVERGTEKYFSHIDMPGEEDRTLKPLRARILSVERMPFRHPGLIFMYISPLWVGFKL